MRAMTVIAAAVGELKNQAQTVEGDRSLPTIVGGVLSAVFVVLGVLAVIFIIIGGINYTVSQGDPSKVKKAKNTILYAIVGLIIALMAFAITNFAMNALQNAN